MTIPTLGLALIARDEEESLPHLLASTEGAFDQVAMLDTGSEDRTVDVFTEWAERQQLPLGFKVDHFTWLDDFAAARNAADSLLETDWLCWADADDVILGAPLLRSLVNTAPADVSGAGFLYNYYPGAPESARQLYVRLSRKGTAHWSGRVHEAQTFSTGRVVTCPSDRPLWVHRCESLASHRARNLRILRDWVDDEPENPTPLGLLAAEELFCGNRDGLLAQCRAFLDRFGDRFDAAQLASAHWALEGLAIAVDSTHPQLVGGADRLLQIVLGPVAGVYSQLAVDPLKADVSLALAQPGSDAVPLRSS